MSVYKSTVDSQTQTAHFKQTEMHLYGSSALGIDKTETELISPPPQGNIFTHTLGNKNYTCSNHLGNDLVVFTDRKIAHEDPNNLGYIGFYTTDLVSSRDYGPFGEYLTNRVFMPDDYPNSFNNKRDDPELNGWQDYGARNYLKYTRRLMDRVDPITKKYPELTPYQFASNRPIQGVDLDGKEFVETATIVTYAAYAGLVALGVVTSVYIAKTMHDYIVQNYVNPIPIYKSYDENYDLYKRKTKAEDVYWKSFENVRNSIKDNTSTGGSPKFDVGGLLGGSMGMLYVYIQTKKSIESALTEKNKEFENTQKEINNLDNNTSLSAKERETKMNSLNEKKSNLLIDLQGLSDANEYAAGQIKEEEKRIGAESKKYEIKKDKTSVVSKPEKKIE